METIYIFCKITFLVYMWAIIFALAFFILMGRSIIRELKALEETIQVKTKELHLELTPLLNDLTSFNENVQKLLGIKKIKSLDILFFITPILAMKSRLFKNIKLALNTVRRFS